MHSIVPADRLSLWLWHKYSPFCSILTLQCPTLKTAQCKFTVNKSQHCSHNADLVGDLEGVEILGEDNVSLLQATGSNQSVNFADLDLVKFFNWLLDHWLSCALVNNENEGVLVFSSLDGTFGASGVLNDGVLVPGLLFRDTVWDSFGLAGKSKSLWESKGNLGPGLGLGSGVDTLLHLFSSLYSLTQRSHLTLHLPTSSFISS